MSAKRALNRLKKEGFDSAYGTSTSPTAKKLEEDAKKEDAGQGKKKKAT